MTASNTAASLGNRTLLEVRGVSKRFGGIYALRDVHLRVTAGTAVALAGENGAGKSTLIKILAGAQSPDSGAILLGGTEARISTPAYATTLGIATVYQELSLLPDLSVAENLFLGQYPKRFGSINWAVMRHQAEQLLIDLELEVAADRPVRELTLAERYLVEIAKAVRHRPRVLILDEPTAALDPQDANKIFALMDGLRAEGTGILFVSHRLEEVRLACQAFMVLKDGGTVGEGRMEDVTDDELVSLMLGREFANDDILGLHHRAAGRGSPEGREPHRTAPAVPTLRITDLTTRSVRGVSFDARKGEIIGIAGLRGAGQSALCRALAGAEHLLSGTMELEGERYRPGSPAAASKAGVLLLPAERKTEGLFMNLSVAQNVAMGSVVGHPTQLVTDKRVRRLAEDYRDRLDIRTPGGSVDAGVGALSGGNQQKVVFARLLAAQPRLLVLDEPTRGVDVGAKAQIHQLIRDLAAEGVCVVLSSSELGELIGLSTKVVVLHRGAMAAELTDHIDEHTIVSLASGSPASGAAGKHDEVPSEERYDH